MESGICEDLGEYVIDNKDSTPFNTDGAFSEIYYCRKVNKKKASYCAKRILKDSKNKEIIETEIYMAKILENMKSPHLLKYQKCVEKEDAYYLIMKFCNAGNLDTYVIHKGFLNLTIVRNFFEHICKGLAEFHNKSLVHRDLKGANIFLHETKKGKIMCILADFGFSKKVEKEGSFETILGTGLTMSPELFNYEKTDRKVDIWALGIILYMMGFGAYPFKDNIKKRIDQGKYFIPKHYVISKEYINAMESCLQYNPSHRAEAKDLLNKERFITKKVKDQELYWTMKVIEISLKEKSFDKRISGLIKDNSLELLRKKAD